jgi:hypothetical protein
MSVGDIVNAGHFGFLPGHPLKRLPGAIAPHIFNMKIIASSAYEKESFKGRCLARRD